MTTSRSAEFLRLFGERWRASLSLAVAAALVAIGVPAVLTPSQAQASPGAVHEASVLSPHEVRGAPGTPAPRVVRNADDVALDGTGTSAVRSDDHVRPVSPASLANPGLLQIAERSYRQAVRLGFDPQGRPTDSRPTEPATTTTTTQPATTAACGAQGRLAPSCGALWGVYTTRGSTLTSAVTDLEAKVGREFDMYLRYHDFSTHVHQGEFPDSHQVATGQRMTLVLAWQARVSKTNQDLRWSEITSGLWDERINAAASRIKAYGKDLIIAFDPEFDRLAHKGTMAEYAAAYRYIHQKFAAAGVTNAVWAWVPTGYIGGGRDKMTMDGYPGSQYVDWVGFDPYNFFTCNNTGWDSFEAEIAPEYNFFVQQGLGSKPFLIMEYGTAFDAADPARAAAWHNEIPSVLERYPNVKGLVRFDANSTSATCNLSIDNGPGMLDSFRLAGLDPYVNTRNR